MANKIQVERRGSYQGVPQYGITGQSEITPSRANAAKWAQLENAAQKSSRCDQCSALMINGLFCHETGCPNTKSRYDESTDTWIKQRKCFECGCTIDANTDCCNEEEL